MSYVIGIDVGSQSVKAVLFDEDGTAIQEAGAPYEMSCPRSGWAEQDPACWERGIAQTVRELRQRSGIGASEVAMLALASQVDGAGGTRRPAGAAAPGDHLARPAGHAAVRAAERSGRGGRADRPNRAESRRFPHRAEGHVAARRGARALPGRALAGARRRSPGRLAHRRGGAGSGQRVVHAAVRAALGRLGPRAGRAGRSRRRQAPADPPRRPGHRAAPGARPPRRSACPPAAGSRSAQATSTGRRSAPAPWLPASWST